MRKFKEFLLIDVWISSFRSWIETNRPIQLCVLATGWTTSVQSENGSVVLPTDAFLPPSSMVREITSPSLGVPIRKCEHAWICSTLALRSVHNNRNRVHIDILSERTRIWIFWDWESQGTGRLVNLQKLMRCQSQSFRNQVLFFIMHPRGVYLHS